MRVDGLGFIGLRIEDLGLSGYGLGFRVEDFSFWSSVRGLGFKGS